MAGLMNPSHNPLLRSGLQRLFLRTDLPTREEIASLPPLRRAVLAGLLLLTAAALVTPVAAMLSLEIAAASQTFLRSGGPGETRAGAPPPGQFDNILQRPLFSRTRQAMAAAAPPAPPETPAAAVATLDLGLVLRGVFMDGVTTKAFLTTPDNPVGTWAAVNDEIAGWRLAEVRPSEVVVEARGERQTLQLSILAK